MEKISFKSILIVLIVVLATISVLLGWVYIREKRAFERIDQERASLDSARDKKIEFLKLFVNKILRGEGEVSFDDRLQLENTIREIDDQQILTVWNDFTEAEQDHELQKQLKELLSIFVNRL